MSKEQQINDVLKELSRAIIDLKKQYGEKIDADYLQDRLEELIKNMKNDE